MCEEGRFVCTGGHGTKNYTQVGKNTYQAHAG
jgi:hypothetical protein